MPLDCLSAAQGKPEDDYRVQGIVGVGSFGVVRKVQPGHPASFHRCHDVTYPVSQMAGTNHDGWSFGVLLQVPKHGNHAGYESGG